MPTHDHGREDTQRKAAPAPARRTAAPPHVPGLTNAQQITSLQSSAGNAAVVQMLRRQGLLQEPHRHGAGCGHEQSEQPAVQRSAVHDVLRRSGKPLDATVRTDMESRLGADFSDVRIHDDAAAKASAAEVGARAYTSGSHVVLGDGGGDRHTLAHELTHVIQQRQGPVAGTDNGQGLKVSDPSDRFEREAEATAHRVLSGPAPATEAAEPVQRAAAQGPGTGPQPVQRMPKAPRLSPEVQRELKKNFTDFFHESEKYKKFDELFYRYMNEGVVPDGVYAIDQGVLKNGLREGLWNNLKSKREAYETEARPMAAEPKGDIRLYRKMSAAEAEQIVGGDSPGAGIRSAMDYNSSDQYRKYFTTALEHTSKFTNENAQNPGDEKVLEFIMPWKKYWEFYKKFGTPNQQKGAFNKRASATVHQELLRTGNGANFTDQKQVDEVYIKATHHNIGIGHGNKEEFIKIVSGIQPVDPQKVEQAVAAARTAMKDAINAQLQAEAQAQNQAG